MDPEEDIRRAGEEIGLELDDETIEILATQHAQQDDILGELDEFSPEPTNRSFDEPTDEEDPNAAYLHQCDVRRETGGKLEGTDIGIKDNIAVAGIPMTCGSPVLDEHVPPEDAVVVTRLLNAGGRIIGKTNMDEFAFGGESATMRFRLARNPIDTERQPGSSSAGSGVAIAEGSADLALGSDTGGSVRFPAAWCGVVGVKPSRGMVPQHGFVNYAPTLDCIGLLTNDLETAARGLEVIAGGHPRDERTLGRSCDGCTAAVSAGPESIESLRLGRPRDLFGSAPELERVVDRRLDELEDRGATIVDLSIDHYDAWKPAWLGIAMTEFGHYLDDGLLRIGTTSVDLSEISNRFSQSDSNQIGDPVTSAWLYAHHLRQEFGDVPYVLANRAREKLTEGFDDALSTVDALVSPTVPMLPPKWEEDIGDVFGALANTGPLNVTGHPAISIPAGSIDGLPVGAQLVGSRFGDAELFRAAAALDSTVDSDSPI